MLFRQSSFLGLRLFVLICCSLALMAYDQHQHQLSHMRAGLSVVIAPVQHIVSWPVTVVDWFTTLASRQQTLIEENANLRAQSLVLKGELQRIMVLKEENKQLRELLQSTSPLVTEKFSIAKLLAVSTDPYVGEVVLDRGKNQGVYSGQPVLDASGVMGQVTQVGPLTSRVMLLTDVRSAIPVQITRNGLHAIALGRGPRRDLVLINIPDTADVRVGDILTTSGLGLRYPEGYPVGVVNHVAHQVGEHFASISVTPSAQLGKSRQLLLVWQKTKQVYQEAKKDLQQIEQDKQALVKKKR